MTARRLPGRGRVDTAHPLAFSFAGQGRTGHPGDTLASALLAHDVVAMTTSIAHGRPRGIGAAGSEDPSSLVQLEHPFPDPMQLATTTELFDGLVARPLTGQGRLADRADPARYDTRHRHCDLLVVGAGPAGLVAALTASRAGQRVVLLDEQPEAGGALLGTDDTVDGAPALEWVAAAVAELAADPDVLHLQRTTAFAHHDDGFVLALERRTDHLGAAAPAHVARQRVWRVRARHVLVAAGAHERPVVFPDNDRPGVLLASGARTYLHRYGVLVGQRPVVLTTDDSGYAVACDLADAGARVVVCDPRPQTPPAWAGRCAERGVEVRPGYVVVGTRGSDADGRVTAALVAPFADGAVSAVGGGPGDDPDVLVCDALCVSGGWNPAVHLFSQVRGRLRYDDALGGFVPAAPLRGVSVAGAARGELALREALSDGERAATGALVALGAPVADGSAVPGGVDDGPARTPGLVLWRVPVDGDGSREYVDLQRDATVADVRRAVGAGLHSVEHVKRYTTIGTAHDQGKTSGVVTSGLVAELLGRPVEQLGTTTFRPPYTPVAFAALAGRARGRLYEPERTTGAHERHVARGAVLEDVGQWKRPRYFPRRSADGSVEDMDAAVTRECVAARTSVAVMDGSTLGTIDVQGPDAGAFLDMLYTNLVSSLKVGRARYGVMCGPDGMVVDDGTVLRTGPERFTVTTTTGGAAMVLDHMEEWLQTEWPDLRVRCTSLTDHVATFPVVGPRSRDVVGALCEGLDVSNDAFGFMQWRDTTIGGVGARVARISFSGELAYEVNVPAWYAADLWERVLAVGAEVVEGPGDQGVTPYGTETMHVLRAEKGYPIIGQDTDGTVTPHDLGLGWAVSRKKTDFLGLRSFSRPANLDPARKVLVGLLPLDGEQLVPEGAQLVEAGAVDAALDPATGRLVGRTQTPVPMLGHVTSAYRSAALGRTFALALLRGGRERVGNVVHAVVDGRPVPVEVTSSVLYDPEGSRRDG